MRSTEHNQGEKLTRKALREIERELGIYLDAPKNMMRMLNQQFGIYNENDEHIGDIGAPKLYFSAETLRAAIREVLNK